jgi:hypothetical protein
MATMVVAACGITAATRSPGPTPSRRKAAASFATSRYSSR